MRCLRKGDQLLVGLPDELQAKPEAAIEEDEGADELAGLIAGLGLPEHPTQDGEQHDSFKHRLVELARMARRPEDALAELVELLEADRPGNRRGGAPQLLVDEVRQAAEKQAKGH